jgi:hypothetical protein
MKIKEMKRLFYMCVDLISNYLIKERLLSPNGKMKYINNIPIKPCISKKIKMKGIKIPCLGGDTSCVFGGPTCDGGLFLGGLFTSWKAFKGPLLLLKAKKLPI